MPGDTSTPSKIPSSVPDLLALKNQVTAALKKQRQAYQEYSDLKKLSEVFEDKANNFFGIHFFNPP